MLGMDSFVCWKNHAFLCISLLTITALHFGFTLEIMNMKKVNNLIILLYFAATVWCKNEYFFLNLLLKYMLGKYFFVCVYNRLMQYFKADITINLLSIKDYSNTNKQ